MCRRLLENYRQQTLLKQQYDTVRTEQAAVDLFGRYRTVAQLGPGFAGFADGRMGICV